jgi:hypothetical protein
LSKAPNHLLKEKKKYNCDVAEMGKAAVLII